MKPMTLKADKDKITFGFEDKPWEEYFDDICPAKCEVFIGDEKIVCDFSKYIPELKDFINTLLKEQKAEILKDLKKAQILADKEQALETDIFLQELINKSKL